MTDTATPSILRRMIAPKVAGPEEVPITSSRAVRMAIQRAAEQAHGLALTVQSLQEEQISLEALPEALTADHLLIGLERDGGMVGLAALDLQLRAAVIEAQTMGRLQATAPAPRPPTGTDAVLMTDVLAGFLKMLTETTARTDLDGWTQGAQVGPRVASLRVAGLALADVDYRLIRLALDLGVADRVGEAVIVLPVGRASAPAVLPEQRADWHSGFWAALSDAQASLTAELHRFEMPLGLARQLQVGQVIPLPGCTVDSVCLRDVKGTVVARARLGQYAGKRAVRIEGDRELPLQDRGIIAPASQGTGPVQLPQASAPATGGAV